MAVKISPRRAVIVDDHAVVRPSPHRRPSPPQQFPSIRLRLPDPIMIRPDIATRSNHRQASAENHAAHPATRDNFIAKSEAVLSIQYPETNSRTTRAVRRMATYEAESLERVRSVGGKSKYLFAGQKGLWEDVNESEYMKESTEAKLYGNNPKQDCLFEFEGLCLDSVPSTPSILEWGSLLGGEGDHFSMSETFDWDNFRDEEERITAVPDFSTTICTLYGEEYCEAQILTAQKMCTITCKYAGSLSCSDIFNIEFPVRNCNQCGDVSTNALCNQHEKGQAAIRGGCQGKHHRAICK